MLAINVQFDGDLTLAILTAASPSSKF